MIYQQMNYQKSLLETSSLEWYEKRPTSLLIDLALLVRKKKLIKHLYDYKAICSYDEVKRFKASAAVENTKNITLNLRNHTKRLVQPAADNFDTRISPQNGKKPNPLARIATDTTKWGWTYWATIDLSNA